MKDIPFKKSPNFSSRKGSPIDMIIIHHTGSTSFSSAVNWFMNPGAEVSAHFVIGREGEIVQMVEIGDKAWHAGKSAWDGRTSLNKYSIGVELCGDGNKLVYTDKQYKTLIDLLKHLMQSYTISEDMILGHEDVSPGRKVDPGKLFDWAKVRAEITELDSEPVPDFKEVPKDDGYEEEVTLICKKLWSILKAIRGKN